MVHCVKINVDKLVKNAIAKPKSSKGVYAPAFQFRACSGFSGGKG